ncbi:hypothetical protein V1478_011202 [Vespula squamosa]|uniref:Uncharacterized protein n=1 Tax=Vespula squamosa TaxID=30214 RepID=A0ABD2ADU7_VESSQ
MDIQILLKLSAQITFMFQHQNLYNTRYNISVHYFFNNLNLICARSNGITALSCGITSKACCFAFLLGLTEKCTSFIAFSIIDTGYGLFDSGFTHLSATVVAISLNMESRARCLSLSETWSSPFARISLQISFVSP